MPASISDASGVKVSYSYLSDGTKLSALKPNGEGLVYRGPFVYRRGSGGALTFESVSADEGRLSSAGEMLYVEDYLGSVRAVVSGSGGTLLEASDYSAFGARAQASSAPIGTTPAGITLRDHYTAQEDQAPDFAVPYTDFGARQYNVGLRRWMTPDPLSEKYYGISPYAFCNNSPMVFVDPDGRDWYSYNLPLPNTDETQTYLTAYKWTNATSQNELDNLGIKGTYLGKAVVVFDGYYDEKLGEDETLTGKGAKTAKVTVYGPKSADDIAYYTGFTMSSDFERFGAIDNGIYNVSFVKNAPNNNIPKTHIIEHGNPVDCLYGINNSYPNYRAYSETQKDRIYIHRTNNNGFAGYNKDRNIAVSVGCLLIHGPDWPYYDKQINNTNYTLILNRR